MVFLGQGVGSTETEAAEAALRSARTEIARVRGVHIATELTDFARSLSLTVRDEVFALSSVELVQQTQETTSATVAAAEPYGPIHVECTKQQCVAYARMAIDEGRAYPGRRLTRVLELALEDETRVLRLMQLAETFEAEGERSLAELTLRMAAQDLQSAVARVAGLRLAWFLFGDGRELEASQWLTATGDFGALDSLQQESAERLSRLLKADNKSYSDYVEELSHLVTRYSSVQHLNLRPLFTQPLPVGADSIVQLDFLIESRNARRTVALLWIDQYGVTLHTIDDVVNSIQGVHLLTLEGRRGLGNVILVGVGAGDIANLLRLQQPQKARLIDRRLAEAGNRGELIAFRSLTRTLGRIMLDAPNAAMVLVRFELD